MNQFSHVCFAAACLVAFSGPAIAQTCPLVGDAKQPLAVELNPYKNRDDAPPVAKINPNASLSAVLASGNDLKRWSRDDGATFEGIVVGVKSGGIESANCHAKDAVHRDTHIELAPDGNARGNQRVVVEVTPRWREKMSVITDWSTAGLKKRLLRRRVRVTGWLFDDLEHRGEAENTNAGGAHNWRATVWEIHPITGITVLPGAPTTLVAPARPTKLTPRTMHPTMPGSKCVRSGAHRCRRTRSRSRHTTHR